MPPHLAVFCTQSICFDYVKCDTKWSVVAHGMPVIQRFRRLRQEDCQLEDSGTTLLGAMYWDLVSEEEKRERGGKRGEGRGGRGGGRRGEKVWCLSDAGVLHSFKLSPLSFEFWNSMTCRHLNINSLYLVDPFKKYINIWLKNTIKKCLL